MSYACICVTVRKWNPASVVTHRPDCPDFRSEERSVLLSECPGGCGMLHRRCCDSVVGSDHQNLCRGNSPRHDVFGRSIEQPRIVDFLLITGVAVLIAGICLLAGVLSGVIA